MPFDGVSQYQQPPLDLSQLGDFSSPPQGEAMNAPPGTGGSSPSASGKKGGPSNWWALAAAPLIAALGSHLSGGKLSMGDAIGSLGQGFAGAKFQQLNQRRQQVFDEENATVALAHEKVQGLSKLSPESMKKFPKIQELADKYNEALSDDGKVSPKEAGEIIKYYHLAEHDMQQAGEEQTDTSQSEDARRKVMEGAQNVEDAQRAGVERQVMRGNWGPLGNAGIQEKVNQGYESEYGTIPVQVNGQTVQMTHKEAVPYLRVKAQKDRADATIKLLRERVGLSRQGLGLANKKFDWAQENATLNRDISLARMYAADPDFEGASPQEIADLVQQSHAAGLNERMKAPPKGGTTKDLTYDPTKPKGQRLR